MKIKFLYLIILFLGLSNIASAAEEQVIVYKNTPEADLTMTILRPDLKKKSRKGTPAILYFFGGGFRGGALDQFRPQAEMLRDKGMIAIMVEYRVKLRHNVLPNKGIEDARTAIRYVRANAKELGIDPNMIVCSGGSSGGHISASLAFVDVFNDENDDLTISTIPDALVLICPGVDSSPKANNSSSLFQELDYDWRDYSPMHNIKDQAPPTIFLVGDQDELVSIEVANTFKEKVEATGARCDVIVYQGADHPFYLSSNHDGKYFRLTMEDTIEFLTELGFIKK